MTKLAVVWVVLALMAVIVLAMSRRRHPVDDSEDVYSAQEGSHHDAEL